MRSNPEFTDMVYNLIMEKIDEANNAKEQERLAKSQAMKEKKDEA